MAQSPDPPAGPVSGSKRAARSYKTSDPPAALPKAPDRAPGSPMRRKMGNSPRPSQSPPVERPTMKRLGNATKNIPSKAAGVRQRADDSTMPKKGGPLALPEGFLTPPSTGGRERAQNSRSGDRARTSGQSISSPQFYAGRSGKIVIFGSGLLARGVLAPIFRSYDWDIVFVDQQNVVHDLNQSTYYHVQKPFVSNHPGLQGSTDQITGYRAFTLATPGLNNEVATADVVACTVVERWLGQMVRVIAAGIGARKERMDALLVVDCEYHYAEHHPFDLEAELQRSVGGSRNWYGTEAVLDKLAAASTGDLRQAVSRLAVRVEGLGSLTLKRVSGVNDYPAPFMQFEKVQDLGKAIESHMLYHLAQTIKAHASLFLDRLYLASDTDVRRGVERALRQASMILSSRHWVTEENRELVVTQIMGRVDDVQLQRNFLGQHTSQIAGKGPITRIRSYLLPVASRLRWYGLPYEHVMSGIGLALRCQNIVNDDETSRLRDLMTGDSSTKAIATHIAQGILLDDPAIIKGEFTNVVAYVRQQIRNHLHL